MKVTEQYFREKAIDVYNVDFAIYPVAVELLGAGEQAPGRDEQGRERHVDAGAVEVERITGRHHQPDDRLGTARALQLLDQRR